MCFFFKQFFDAQKYSSLPVHTYQQFFFNNLIDDRELIIKLIANFATRLKQEIFYYCKLNLYETYFIENKCIDGGINDRL
jgi:hypothetical protein